MAVSATSMNANDLRLALGTTTTGLGVVSASVTENGNPIDLTLTTDTSHQYKNGITDFEMTVEVLGDDTWMALGSTESGATTLTLTTGSEVLFTVTNCLITNVDRTGTLDGPMTTSLTFKPERQNV